MPSSAPQREQLLAAKQQRVAASDRARLKCRVQASTHPLGEFWGCLVKRTRLASIGMNQQAIYGT